MEEHYYKVLAGAIEDLRQDIRIIRDFIEGQTIGRKPLSAREVAEMTGLSIGTIRNKVYRGEIPHKKAGSKVLFDAFEIERWMLEAAAQKKNGNRS